MTETVSDQREQGVWRTTLLAGSASYLDAGSIVAGAVGLRCGPRTSASARASSA